MDGVTDDEKRHNINSFLQEFKNLLWEGKFLVKNRGKNLEALIDLGLTERQREEEILSLSVTNYCSGPTEDQYHNGVYYWEFGKTINGVEVYIKLEIASKRHDEVALCLSFHRAEYPVKYPFSK